MANVDLDRKLICTFSLKAPSIPLLSQAFFPSTLVPFPDIPTCCFVALDVAEDGQDQTDSGAKDDSWPQEQVHFRKPHRFRRATAMER